MLRVLPPLLRAPSPALRQKLIDQLLVTYPGTQITEKNLKTVVVHPSNDAQSEMSCIVAGETQLASTMLMGINIYDGTSLLATLIEVKRDDSTKLSAEARGLFRGTRSSPNVQISFSATNFETAAAAQFQSSNAAVPRGYRYYFQFFAFTTDEDGFIDPATQPLIVWSNTTHTNACC